MRIARHIQRLLNHLICDDKYDLKGIPDGDIVVMGLIEDAKRDSFILLFSIDDFMYELSLAKTAVVLTIFANTDVTPIKIRDENYVYKDDVSLHNRLDRMQNMCKHFIDKL